MRLTRADRSILSDWWFTVDRLMFFGLLLLMGAGPVSYTHLTLPTILLV